MREMKDSGVEWIGSVPESWRIHTIGSLFKVRNEKVNDTDYPPLSVSKGGIVPQMDNVAKTDARDNRKKVQQNDFVINSRSDRKQSCGLSSLTGSVSLINIVLYAAENAPLAPAYVNYLLKNYGFAEEFYRWGHGIVADLWTTRWQEMKSILLPVPSEGEQEAIAQAIDSKLTKVDALISNVQAQIEKLKAYKQSLITEVVTKGLDPTVPMKDSGVEWIGEIPEHWSITRIKNVANIVRGASPRPIDNYLVPPGQGENWIKIGDTVKGFKYITQTAQQVSIEGAEKSRRVHKGDLILTNSMSFGEPYILSIDGCIHDGWLALTSLKGIIKDYMYYFLQSSLCFLQFKLQVAGGIVQNLNSEKVASCLIFYPREKEQEAIVAYLDKKCAQIDRLIGIKQEKITKLEQYKRSLIYEYVTGKKEVK